MTQSDNTQAPQADTSPAQPSPAHPTEVIVVGAGPVGLAAALLLAQQGRTVTVYEGRDELLLTDENSYPIGVNVRGQEALRRIDPALLQALRDTGELVEGFVIRNGTRTVAKLPSGTLTGTTRARLTRILFDAARTESRIRIVTGHRLRALDRNARRLDFTTTADESVGVDASRAIVLACDGVWSPARHSLTEAVPGFDPVVGDWGVQFRVLFSQAGATAPGLDPAQHHIFTSKGIYTATLPNGVWCIAVTAIKGDPAESLLLSTDATDENVAALRAHLAEHAPLVPALLREEDYRAYFFREPFGGAVVRCLRIAFNEWLVLLGDAAHSVIPPTGEGVNSGLEDAFLLTDTLATESATPLADYERNRMPDLEALGEYAWQLKENLRTTDPAETASNVIVRILSSVSARFGRSDGEVEQRLFGPDADLTRYAETIGPWIAFRDRWTPLARTAVRGVLGLRPAVRRVSTRIRRQKGQP